MKVLFWNIKGLGRATRRRQLKELVCSERGDAVGIQETIKKKNQRERVEMSGG